MELLIEGQVMKKPGWIVVVLSIVVFAGCQQSQQEQATDISRRDRLIATENLNLRNELARCQDEIENQKTLLRQCEEEKEQADQQANESIKWLMDELPEELLNDAAKLTEENANLTARIAELEGALKQANSPPQQK